MFRDDLDRRAFLARLAEYKKRFRLAIYHYCLMDNHFHLVVRPHMPRDLPTLMAGLLRSYVHYYHKRYGFVGHLWQGRFKSPAVQVDAYLNSCGRYVERNPIAVGFVERPWEYPWSSCRASALGIADELVDENPSVAAWGATAERRQALWREFLMGGDDKEAEVARGDVVGDAAFRASCETCWSAPGQDSRSSPGVGGVLVNFDVNDWHHDRYVNCHRFPCHRFPSCSWA